MMLTIRQNATSLLLFLEWGRHFRRGITQNNSGENFTLRMVNDWIRRGQAKSNKKKIQVGLYNIFFIHKVYCKNTCNVIILKHGHCTKLINRYH